jgi:hypothetical protein
MTQVHEGTLNAWIIDDYHSEGAMSGDTDRVLRSLHFCPHKDMESAGWVFAGTARIELTMVGTKSLVENKVESLKAQQKSILAEAQNKHTELERKIQTLLAITFEG